MGDVPAHPTGTDPDGAGVGVPGHQGAKGLAANVHIHAANDHGVVRLPQHIAFPGDVAFLHQIGNVHRNGGAGNPCPCRQRLLGDHGIFRNPLENLLLPLCHGHLLNKYLLSNLMLIILSAGGSVKPLPGKKTPQAASKLPAAFSSSGTN